MDEELLHTSRPEEEALKIMETADTAGLPTDEACRQACADLTEMAVAMRIEKGTPEIDVEKELAAFRRRKRRVMRQRSIAACAAAAALVLGFALHLLPAGEGIVVFRADTAVQQVTLKAAPDNREIPLADALRTLPTGTARVSPHEINYTAEKIEEAIARNRATLHRLRIPRGEMFRVVLSDGTEVLLNADSRLAYPTLFSDKERVVSLEGEAYFKVAPDAERPFIVRSGAVRTRAVGTEFNVRHYGEEACRVTLMEGRVEVSDTCGKQAVTMVPGQRASLCADGTFLMEEVDLDPYLYGKEGYFYFDNILLEDMMREIGRWYNVDVEFRNREAMSLHVHFFADRRKGLSETLRLLNRMEKVEARCRNGRITIY